MYPLDTYPKDIYPPDTYPLDTYPPDTYPLGHVPPGTYTPWTDTPWANKTSTDLWNWKKEISIYFAVIDLLQMTIIIIPLFLPWPVMRKLQNRIEKKEHGFIVSVMANEE